MFKLKIYKYLNSITIQQTNKLKNIYKKLMFFQLKIILKHKNISSNIFHDK